MSYKIARCWCRLELAAPVSMSGMDSLSKFIASIAALIASLSIAWIAVTLARSFQNHYVRYHITTYHENHLSTP